LSASKVLPKFADFFFQDTVFLFQFFYHAIILREVGLKRLEATVLGSLPAGTMPG